jgi:hypothetical protein
MNEGPSLRYMTAIAVRVGNVTVMFDTYHKPAHFLEKLNALLAPVGAKASGDEFHTTLTLCDGQRVKITQKHYQQYYFLNIEYDVPGCHDKLGGIIGQLFQCK